MNKTFENVLEEVKRTYAEEGVKMTYWQMALNLKDYVPERAHMTSMGEIRMLRNFMGLYEMSTYEMQNLRDMIVMAFTGWIDMHDGNTESESEKRWNFTQAMSSITAVIDDMMYRENAI